MNGVGSKYFLVVNCTVQLVPNESAAWSSRMTERPIVSQPLSEPVEMSGRPAGMPVRAQTSSVTVPMTVPDGTRSHSFSFGTSQKQRVRLPGFIQRRFL